MPTATAGKRRRRRPELRVVEPKQPITEMIPPVPSPGDDLILRMRRALVYGVLGACSHCGRWDRVKREKAREIGLSTTIIDRFIDGGTVTSETISRIDAYLREHVPDWQ